MAKTLKELIAAGHVDVSYEDTNDSVKVTRKRYNPNTGDEETPQTEDMTREQIDYYIAMRQQQIADLEELKKVMPAEAPEKTLDKEIS